MGLWCVHARTVETRQTCQTTNNGPLNEHWSRVSHELFFILIFAILSLSSESIVEDREGVVDDASGVQEELIPSLRLRNRDAEDQSSSSGSEASVVLYESRFWLGHSQKLTSFTVSSTYESQQVFILLNIIVYNMYLFSNSPSSTCFKCTFWILSTVLCVDMYLFIC